MSTGQNWKKIQLSSFGNIEKMTGHALGKRLTGGSKLYHIKLSERDFIMWWHMQQTQIIPHIRAISYGFIFSSKSWSHDKPKFYHIFNLLETQIIPHFRVTIFLVSLRILITCQTQILLHFQFARNPNYTTFSNHYDLTCPRLIFNDSLHFILNKSWLIFLTCYSWLVVLTRDQDSERNKKYSDSKMWYNLGFEQIEDVVKFGFVMWSRFWR